MGAINKLTAAALRSELANGWHSDGGGLYLFVDGPAPRWVFRYRWKATGEAGAGKRRHMGLGPLRDVTLAQARAKAAACRDLLRQRKDPMEVRDASGITAPTFGKVADDYIRSMEPTFRNRKHREQWWMTLGDAYCKDLRAVPIDRVVVAHVLAVLSPIWLTKAETASRIRGRIERVIDSATARGQRAGDNPARWKGHLSHLLPTRRQLQRGHYAAMPRDEIAAFVGRLRAWNTVSSYALEFAILTAGRTGEVIGARWEEIAGDVWIIPGSRMKSRREHRVPLCRRALAILERMRVHGTVWCFPGQKHGQHISNMTMLKLLRDMGVVATVHGFRSTFRDWAGDCTSYPREIIEAALAHSVGDKTEAAYRRGDALDRRRALMAAWEMFCEPEAAANVIRLRG
jgi:integrase